MSSFCPLCRAGRLAPLPLPSTRQSLLSDGRVVQRHLAKSECDRCGGTTHTGRLDRETVAAFYERNYALPSVAIAANEARGELYADWLLGHTKELHGRVVLEVGCGSGALLRAITAKARPLKAVGCDPAIGKASLDDPARIYAGDLASIPDHEGPFDLVYSVNVIEHVLEPVGLLNEITRRLKPGGRMIFVMPAAYPNLALLFFDHVTTFTREAMVEVARRAGCRVTGWELAPSIIGDFQMFIIEVGIQIDDYLTFERIDFSSARRRYLQRWRALDAILWERLRGFSEVAIFGAGEATALLRAYAPMVWERVTFLTIDEPSEAWSFDLPVRRISDVGQSADRAMIVGVKPGRQSFVAERLSREGHMPITWERDILEEATS